MRPMRLFSTARLQRWFKFIGQRLVAYSVSAIATALPRIRSVSPGADPHAGSSKIAIYVAYDRRSLLADYVLSQVAALAETGRKITFIWTSPKLPPDAVALLHPFISEFVHRRNIGHDFGAYKDGIARLGPLDRYDNLLLMNDSCYGPFRSLSEVDEQACASGADIFSITDSWDFRYHLQTYYLWIGERALRSAAFTEFWSALLHSQPREMVIANGEVRFTQMMLKAGLTARALCPYGVAAQYAKATALARLGRPALLMSEEKRYLEFLVNAITYRQSLNPTHFFWDVLITQCGMPFIKRDLLRRNPARIPGLLDWEDVVGGLDVADLQPIRDHLQLG